MSLGIQTENWRNSIDERKQEEESKKTQAKLDMRSFENQELQSLITAMQKEKQEYEAEYMEER